MDYIKKESLQTYYRLGSRWHSFFSIFVVLFVTLSTITPSIIRADEERVSEFDLRDTREQEPANKKEYSEVPVVSEEQSLSEIEDKNQIVQKFFKLQTYSPTSMAQIIEPILSKNGFLSVDEDARILLVIDTVEKLITFERIIKGFDTPYDHTTTSIFELKNFNSNKAADIISKMIDIGFIQLPPDNIVASLSEKNWLFARTENSKDLVLIENLLLVLDWPFSDTSLDQSSYTSNVYEIKYINPEWFGELFKFIFKDSSGIQITVEDSKKSLIVFAHKSTHEKIAKFLEILDIPNKKILTGVSARVTDAKSEFDRRNDSMVVVNLVDVELKQLMRILSEWMGKEIIFTDDAKNVRISIYAPRRILQSTALDLIYFALEAKGFVAKLSDDVIYIEHKSKSESDETPAKIDSQSFTEIVDKAQIVQKFFELKNISPSNMTQIVEPMLSNNGFLSIDEEARILMVIDTIENLTRIEQIIERFDAEPEVGHVGIFEVRDMDPNEIVHLIRIILERQKNNKSSSLDSNDSEKPPISMISDPENNRIIARASAEDLILIEKWITKLESGTGPNMLKNQPLSDIEDKGEIVQKFYYLEHSSPQQLAPIIEPLLSCKGYLSSEENTGTLLVIDTVENLIKLEQIIKLYDKPYDHGAATIFELKYINPDKAAKIINEIIKLGITKLTKDLIVVPEHKNNWLIARGSSENIALIECLIEAMELYLKDDSSKGRIDKLISRLRKIDPKKIEKIAELLENPLEKTSQYQTCDIISLEHIEAEKALKIINEMLSTVNINHKKKIFIEDQKNQMLVFGDKDFRQTIINILQGIDTKSFEGAQTYDIILLTYENVEEIAERLKEIFGSMEYFTDKIFIHPLTETNQLLLFGEKEVCEAVRKMVTNFSPLPYQLQREVFILKYVDPEEIQLKIEDTFNKATDTPYKPPWITGEATVRKPLSADTIRTTIVTTIYPSLKRIVVLASAANLVKIRKLINEWDKWERTVDVERIKPRIIELGNIDPKEMVELLNLLFSGSDIKSEARLHFQDVPGTRKIIIISNSPEVYDVCETLIRDLDV